MTEDPPLPLPKSEADIEAVRRERLPLVVERAQRAPFHKERLAGIDAAKMGDEDAFREVPILDKEELRALSPEAFMNDFNMAPTGDIMEFWRSGGSTGKPLFYPRTFADMPYMYLGFTRGIQCAGIAEGDTAHISFPLGIHPVGHMYARVCQQAGVGVNWAGAGSNTPSAMQVQLIDTLKPTAWMGMSSYALHLANLAEAEGIDLAASSVRRIVTSAEPLSEAKRAKIERMWGATVYDTFGMTECCLMGGEDDGHDGFRIWTDMFHIEVLDPDTHEPVGEGEIGTLVSTPLWTNDATPFVRWNSGDLVTWRRGGDGSGPFAVFPAIRHAHRTTGFFKVRGVNINHSDFEDFMFANAAVNDFKCEVVTVKDLDRLLVSIEIRRGAKDEAVVAGLDETIKNTFELAPDVVVLEPGTLAREFEGAVKAPRFVDRRA